VIKLAKIYKEIVVKKIFRKVTQRKIEEETRYLLLFLDGFSSLYDWKIEREKKMSLKIRKDQRNFRMRIDVQKQKNFEFTKK